jgi:hypothetical protein
MHSFYVNKSGLPNGDHDVHLETCEFVPLPENRLYLGEFEDCDGAVEKAKEYFPPSVGCQLCNKACRLD